MKIKKVVKRVVAVIAAAAMIMESAGIVGASSLNKIEDDNLCGTVVSSTVTFKSSEEDEYYLEYGTYDEDDEDYADEDYYDEEDYEEDYDEDDYEDDKDDYETYKIIKRGITATIYTDGIDGEVTLSWKKVKRATRYEVWAKDGKRWKKLVTTKNTKYFDDVDEDTTYRIIAKGKVGKKWKKLKTRKIKVTL